ncbi:MAG: 30S ribosomal protein S6 [Elusimicrobiota bacterium]
MHTYETVMAIPSTLSKEEIDENVDKIEKLIEDNDGEVSSSESLGERQMAYKVKDSRRAFYHMVKFQSPGEFINKLREYYRLNSAYIRDMTIRTDK